MGKFGTAGSEVLKCCGKGEERRDEEDACDGKARELKPQVEKPLGKEEEKEENGELQAVESATVTRKEANDGGDAEHQRGTDERDGKTGHKDENPNDNER